MSQAKTASKNNPNARAQAREFTYNGQKIKPVKLITKKSTYLAAEYDGSGDIVLGADNKPLTWDIAKLGG